MCTPKLKKVVVNKIIILTMNEKFVHLRYTCAVSIAAMNV